MDIRKFAQQFVIYIFDSDPDNGTELKVGLGAAGYDCFYFSDWQQLNTRIEQQPPHILYFSIEQFQGHLNDFVEKLLQRQPNIRFIVTAPVASFSDLSNYSSYGLEWIFINQVTSDQMLWAVDRTAEKLYLQFQNLELLRELRGLQVKEKENKELAADKSAFGPFEPWEQILAAYRSVASREEVLQLFFDRIKEVPAIYFRYLSGTLSIVALQSSQSLVSGIQGLGFQFATDKIKDLGEQIRLGFIPPEMSETLKSKLGMKQVRALPIFALGQLEALIVYDAQVNASAIQFFQNEFSLMSLVYSHLLAEKRLNLLEQQDPVTELYNARVFLEKLREEVSRARRARSPLSLIKIGIDDFYEVEQSLGESARDLLLRNVTAAMRASARSNDILCRSAMNELSMILPMCHRKGAMLRAERLRRVVEKSQSLLAGVPISISVGISEFPSLCSSAEALSETAGKALVHIQDRGGNKLCVYKAPTAHQPEFHVDIEAN